MAAPSQEAQLKEVLTRGIPYKEVEDQSKFYCVCGECRTGMTAEEFGRRRYVCPFPCPFGCGRSVTLASLENHCKGGLCSKYFVKCPGSMPPLGCQWTGLGATAYKEHVDSCPLARFALDYAGMQKTITELQIAIDEKNTEIAQLKQQVESYGKTPRENGFEEELAKYVLSNHLHELHFCYKGHILNCRLGSWFRREKGEDLVCGWCERAVSGKRRVYYCERCNFYMCEYCMNMREIR